ncbi:anti-sigma factor domain-containing protein [Nonomuraea sp. KM90]|uniref:anti-sigma factor n=1 Tax=Nonomuraea sp. KM90 TaxID=3457428 RepID=UPI003FCE2323
MKDELHTLSGAYAVHALPYAEWVLFEEHLHACQGCAAEVRRLRETAARLAEAVAEPPPAGLRIRLLDAAHRSRPPDARSDPRSDGRSADRPDGWPGHWPERVADDSPTVWRPPRERAPAALPPDAPTMGLPGGLPGGRQVTDPPTLSLPPEAAFRMAPEIPVTPEGGQVVPLRRRRTKVLAALSAVSAAAAVALGAVAIDARRDLGDLTTRNEEMIAVLAAPDAETMRQPVTTGGTGTLVISRAEGRMVFTSSGLADLPDTQVYELWLMGPDGPRPAGLLDRSRDGVSPPVVVTPLDRDERVALTVEPARGSDKPTTQPVMLAELPEA